VSTAEGSVRARSYPWGNINVDEETFNDLGLLQRLLFKYRTPNTTLSNIIYRKLFVKLQKHASETVYESYRSQVLPTLPASHTLDALRSEASPSLTTPSKIDLITRKALERLRLSLLQEQV